MLKAHLSADGVGRPQRHGQRLAVAADEVAVMEDDVFGAEEHGRAAMWQVSTVWVRKGQKADRHGRTTRDEHLHAKGSGRPIPVLR